MSGKKRKYVPTETEGVTDVSRKNKKKTGNGAGTISFGTVFLILAGIFGFSGLIKLLVFLGLSALVGSVVRISPSSPTVF